jgi:hypothetical protein
VTVDGWVDVVRRTRVQAAVIGVVTPDDRAAARSSAPSVSGVAIVAVGGAGPDLAGDGIMCSRRVAEAAEVAVGALGQRR